MTDMATDLDSLFGSIESESRELREQDPEHELLRFSGAILGTENWTDELRTGFIDLFATERGTTWAQAWCGYFIALETATGRRSGKNESADPRWEIHAR